MSLENSASKFHSATQLGEPHRRYTGYELSPLSPIELDRELLLNRHIRLAGTLAQWTKLSAWPRHQQQTRRRIVSSLNLRSSYGLDHAVVQPATMERGLSPDPERAPKAAISVVTFDVIFDAKGSGFTAEEALLQIFAYSGIITLRDRAKTKASYVCGNYDQDRIMKGVWTGEIEMQRSARPTRVYRDARTGNRFAEYTGEAITTAEDRSSFAYFPHNNVIAYRERAGIPYTRLRSFVQAAAAAYQETPFFIDLRPHKSDKAISETLEAFTRLIYVRVSYRHSQSPGNALIDQVVDELQADEIVETVKAHPNQSLKQQAFTRGSSQIARAVEHIERNDRNGQVKANGTIGTDYLKFDSKSAVTRRRIDVNNTPNGVALGLAMAAKKFPVKD